MEAIMRVDFSKQQFSPAVEQQYIRLMRVVRTFIASIVIASIGAVLVYAWPASEGHWVDGFDWDVKATSHAATRDATPGHSDRVLRAKLDADSSPDPALNSVEGVVHHG